MPSRTGGTSTPKSPIRPRTSISGPRRPTSTTLAEEESGVVLETVDESSAFSQLHPGAVYLHQGEPYLITDLDLESRTAYAAKTDVPYYTEVRDFTDTRVLNVYKQKLAGDTTVYLGEVNVSTSVVGFKRKAHFTEEVLGEEYVSLPPQSFDTTALWFDVPTAALDYIDRERLDLAGGLHAVEHAAIGVLPLYALCDRNDIGGISTPLHPDTGRPQVFIHDGHPGGVGIAEHGYEVILELWKATLDVVSECPLRGRLPELHPVAQVREQQSAAGQRGGPAGAAGDSQAGRRRGWGLGVRGAGLSPRNRVSNCHSRVPTSRDEESGVGYRLVPSVTGAPAPDPPPFGGRAQGDILETLTRVRRRLGTQRRRD